LFFNGSIIGVLDIDNDKLGSFDETDQFYLEKICVFASRNSGDN
jgi:putative methionine-R-sulfoxide reductase with GAF domain